MKEDIYKFNQTEKHYYDYATTFNTHIKNRKKISKKRILIALLFNRYRSNNHITTEDWEANEDSIGGKRIKILKEEYNVTLESSTDYLKLLHNTKYTPIMIIKHIVTLLLTLSVKRMLILTTFYKN